MGFVRAATVEDATHIANNLREADRMECDALLALPPILVLPAAVASGRRVWTFHAHTGEPVGLFGVDPTHVPEVGTIWMCSTDSINKHKHEFLVQSRPYLWALNDEFPILTNMVDARNTLHHRWLKWLGFAFLQRIEKWGARSVPFIEFARLQRTCA